MKISKKAVLSLFYFFSCLTATSQDLTATLTEESFLVGNGLLTISIPLIAGGLISFIYFRFIVMRKQRRLADEELARKTQELINAQIDLIERNEAIKRQSDKILINQEQITTQNGELKKSIEELKLVHSILKSYAHESEPSIPNLQIQKSIGTGMDLDFPLRLDRIHNKADEIFIRKVIHLIEEHISDPDLDYREICEKMAISKSVFYIKFKAITGQGVQEFIKTIRLKRSLKFLAEGEMTIHQVALEVGFNSQSYFNKCFIKQYGLGPKEYAKKNRDTGIGV